MKPCRRDYFEEIRDGPATTKEINYLIPLVEMSFLIRLFHIRK